MSRDFGIDLGTSNVLIHLKGRGIVLNEPAMIAVRKDQEQVIAIGEEAYRMKGRTSSAIEVSQPLRKGVIYNLDYAVAMLSLFLEKVYRPTWYSSFNLLICSPTNITEVERRALVDVAHQIGGKNIYIEEEAKVAAVGAGIDIFDGVGHMVVDIGGGSTDIGVIANGQVIASHSLRIAGNELDQAIIDYFRNRHHFLIGEASAEAVKKELATARPIDNQEVQTIPLKGQNLLTSLPHSLNVDGNQIYQAIRPSLMKMAQAIRDVIENLPAEISGDIYENGILLTGGGALIQDIDTFLTTYLKLSVISADQPLSCVAVGTSLIFDYIESGQLINHQYRNRSRLGRLYQKLKEYLLGI